MKIGRAVGIGLPIGAPGRDNNKWVVTKMLAAWILTIALLLGTSLILAFLATYVCVVLGMWCEDRIRRRHGVTHGHHLWGGSHGLMV